jgi:hypothetical protein
MRDQHNGDGGEILLEKKLKTVHGRFLHYILSSQTSLHNDAAG